MLRLPLARSARRTLAPRRHLSQLSKPKPTAKKPIVIPAAPQMDPSFASYLAAGDMQLGRRPRAPPTGPPSEPSPPAEPPQPPSSSLAEAEQEDPDEAEDNLERRPERRSPAAVLGTKNLGMVILPRQLVASVQELIDESDSPKWVRAAYKEILDGPKRKQPGGSLNLPDHAVARAAAILPGEYAAMRSVLGEMRARLGSVPGPVLEVSGGLGPGLWATHETFGADVTANSQLVHHTRHGLEVAERLAAPLNANWSFRRDMSKSDVAPGVALSTFHLSTLPKPANRIAHLRQILATDPEYIVIVDRSSPEGWAAISEARDFFLTGRKKGAPPMGDWHVIAPCPHDGICPRTTIDSDEGCVFAQRLQRPSFLRKTKHGKRGEEASGYAYLVVARGGRPEMKRQDGSLRRAGRVGGIGNDEAAKEARKGHTELRKVEGGEGEFEMVSIVPETVEAALQTIEDKKEDPAKVDGALKDEAYAWPRLVAPPMKRSGHVVLDACMQDGTISRFRVARSHGKQAFYDARKSAWGDLFPHTPKSKLEVRTRGVRDLAPQSAEEIEKEAEKEVEHDMDAIFKRLGAKPVFAELVSEDGAADKPGAQATESKATPGAPSSSAAEDGASDPAKPQPGVGRGRRRRTSSTLLTNVRREYSTSAAFSSLTPFSRPFSTSSSARSVHGPMQIGSGPPARPKLTVGALQAMHDAGTPITVLTAYDYGMALVCARAGVDILLIGDSLAQVHLGHATTVPLTLEEVAHHVRAVARGAGSSFILADMPFGYAESSVADGVKAAVTLMKAGADGIKLEGGLEHAALFRRLAECGIPVMPHIGLMPQRATVTGYKAQARRASSALELVDTAVELAEAGAFGLLLEAIPPVVAREITQRAGIPTIGIGAGADTSGQVLVTTDMWGTYDMRTDTEAAADVTDGTDTGKPQVPKFVREFGAVGREMRRAVDGFNAAVRDRSFPQKGAETYGMPKAEVEAFLGALKQRDGAATE